MVWTPQFQALEPQFMDSVTIAAFDSQPITPPNVCDKLIAVILILGEFHYY